jgi:gamma-tubulin complex component 3
MATSTSSSEGQEPGSDNGSPAGSGGLTLLRLGLWTEEMKLKMRMMASVVEVARSKLSSCCVSVTYLGC